MKDQNNKKEDDRVAGLNPVVATVVGAVVGTGIAIAGVVLSDKKNRDNIQKTVNNIKDQVEEKVTKDKEKIKLIVDTAKISLHQAAIDVNKAVQTV